MGTAANFIRQYRAQVGTISIEDGNNLVNCWDASANGSSISHVSVTNTDTNNRPTTLYLGEAVTLQADAGTFATTGNTVTRTTGSFIADGWKRGDKFIVLDRSDDSFTERQVNIVATTVLTSTTSIGSKALTTNENLYRVAPLVTSDVPGNAGMVNATAAVNLIDLNKNPAFDDTPSRFVTVGPNGKLFAKTSNTLPDATEVRVIVTGGEY